MKPFVRRSHLVVSLANGPAIQTCWTHNADAVVFDLANPPTLAAKAHARTLVKDAIPLAAKGGADVFVQTSKATLHADLEASTWPGLRGIVLTGAEASADVLEAHLAISDVERRRGFPEGSLLIIVLLGTAKGVWNIREIITASPRVCSVGMDETALASSLGIVPTSDFDPFVYNRGRVVIEAIAAEVQPIGIAFPYGLLPRVDRAEEVYQRALDGRNLGFKGALCPNTSWVEPCNRAFSPPDEQVAFHRAVRGAFAEGVARGTAAVPFQGRMIDVPVDERARATIALYERCKARDEQKAAALAIAKTS